MSRVGRMPIPVPEGVTVTIKKDKVTVTGPKGELKRRFNPDMKITLKDTGVGISHENVSKLFTPLFSTKAKGVGLGLVICKQIVHGHGGDVTVESKEGVGTRFTIELPIRPEKDTSEETAFTVGLPIERSTRSN